MPDAEAAEFRTAGQTPGNGFEIACAGFLRWTFLRLGRLRPGAWDIRQATGADRRERARYDQYSRLEALDGAAKGGPVLAAALGSDCIITPDNVAARAPEGD